MIGLPDSVAVGLLSHDVDAPSYGAYGNVVADPWSADVVVAEFRTMGIGRNWGIGGIGDGPQ
jgi:hypothetical protein